MSNLCTLQTVLGKLISELDYGKDFSNYPSMKSIVAQGALTSVLEDQITFIARVLWRFVLCGVFNTRAR